MRSSHPTDQYHDRSLTIRDDAKVYSDEEAALILREAAQLADSPPRTFNTAAGLSLQQIKAAASEAGLDPVFVERAALRISERSAESLVERLMGGPVRHRQEIHLPVKMDGDVAARLLSTIRAYTGAPGEGRADASGFFLYAWLRGSRLSVTAHGDSGGTWVQVRVDRSAALFLRLFFALVSIVMSILILGGDVDGYPDLFVLAVIPIAVLAATRALWRSSTRALRETTAMLLEKVTQLTGESER